MASTYSLICVFALFFLANVFGEEEPEECRPKPPEHGKEREICCKVPNALMKKKEDEQMKKVFHGCIESLKEKHPDILPEKPKGPPGRGPPHHHHGPPPVHFLECLEECIFNATGLMTADMKPNAEAMKKMTEEFIGGEDKLKPVAEQAIKKCTESSPTVKDDSVCKSGAHQITICMMREMFMNCPADLWTDSEECKAEKALLEKCPNKPPPFPHHGRGPGGHRKH